MGTFGQESSFKTIDESMMSNNDLSGKVVKRKNTSPMKSSNKSPNAYNSNKNV